MVSLFNILQLIAVGDQRGGIDFACFYEGENLGAVTAVHAAGFKGQVLAVHLGQWKALGLVVEGHHRDDGIGASTLPGHAEGVLCACHFQHHIGTAMIGVGESECFAVLRGAGQHIGVMLMDEGNSCRIFFADDDPLRILQKHAHEGAEARGACADDENSVLLGNFGDSGCPEAGGQHIAHQQSLLVSNGVGNLVQPLIRIGHPDKISLSAVNAAA